ncbi:hypothetical protein P692DRAFT_20834726 [Suillus brevipes Sb2]|nr:hypothetical protein P692DRAFT_20834726 [Suillus brevipes Sb2]
MIPGTLHRPAQTDGRIFEFPSSSLGAGSSFNVDIVYRVSGFRGKQVAVVVAIQCTPSCWPGEALGDIPYDGPYDPRENPNPGGLQLCQNFAVPVPPNLMGNALLAVTHVALRRSQED